MEYEITYEIVVMIDGHSPEHAKNKLSSQLDIDIGVQSYNIINIEEVG